MKDRIDASVVIATYNGSCKIPFLLRALLNQTVLNFEVIVVIDGSTDNTLQVIENFKSLFKQFKIVVQLNQGRSRVRNNGVIEASTDIVIFYDDDMIPLNNSIERHIWFHKRNYGILSGNSIEQQTSDKTDIQNYKAFLTEEWTKKYPEGVTQLDFSNLFYTAANASLRKKTFDELNGFDVKLTDAEDHDFACRALIKGIPVFFDKDNKAIHHEFITCIGYIKRLRLYAHAHSRLKKMYQDRYSNLKNKKSIIKQIIYRTFSMPWWPHLIENFYLVKHLPRRVRYKLYDLIIQSLANEYPNVKL